MCELRVIDGPSSGKVVRLDGDGARVVSWVDWVAKGFYHLYDRVPGGNTLVYKRTVQPGRTDEENRP